MNHLSIDLNNAAAVIQGFGNVGSYAALDLQRFGLKVIAVSDHTGALYDKAGLDVPGLMQHPPSTAALPDIPTSWPATPPPF